MSTGIGKVTATSQPKFSKCISLPSAGCQASVTANRDIFSSDVWRALSDSLGLSEREFEIVLGVFDDETETGIADRLGISRHTVHTYTQRLYRKLGVASRTQLILQIVGNYLALRSRNTTDDVPLPCLSVAHCRAS